MNTAPMNPDMTPETLALKLSEALQENRTLHDRLAELDISMNIEAVELRKDIEALEKERDDLTNENENLIEDYTAKDLRIQELLRQIEIKQMMINETSSYLSAATDRIKSLERQCLVLEEQYKGIYGNQTASEKFEEDEEPQHRNTLIEDVRREFSGILEKKEIEIESLHRSMELLKEENRSLEAEKKEIEKERLDTPESGLSLENTLQDMEHSLTGLEQRISRASEIGVTEKEEIMLKLDDAQREIFSLREYHRSLLEALRKTDEEAKNSIFSLDDYHKHNSLLESLRVKQEENDILKSEICGISLALREKDTEIENLMERIGRETIESSSAIKELEIKLVNASEAVSLLETELANYRNLDRDLEMAIRDREDEIEKLKLQHLSEKERLKKEAEAASDAAKHASGEITKLESAMSDKDAEIESLGVQIAELCLADSAVKREIDVLNSKIAEYQIISESKNSEAEGLSEKCATLEEDNRRLAKASEDYISALKDTISLKDHEIDELMKKVAELKGLLETASEELASSRKSSEISLDQNREIDKLKAEKEALSLRLGETKNDEANIEEMKSAFFAEIKKLADHVDAMKDKGIAEQIALKNDIDSSFSTLAESTLKLEQAISEGLPLMRKLEEVSSEILRTNIPAVYTAVPHEPDIPAEGSRIWRTIAVLSITLLIAFVIAFIFRHDIRNIFAQKFFPGAALTASAWASGSKTETAGPYSVTLTFLSRETVHVLGFSDVISDSDLMKKTFALVEMKSSGSCIPEGWISSPENNMAFLDNQGKTVKLNDPGQLSELTKTIYKQNACIDGTAGTIYLKHIISVNRGHDLRGFVLRGLTAEPIILQ